MKLTIKEIAELAGVSITTVSQILNNKGSRFSEQTRARVLEVVEEHQYKPDYFASNLINRHSKTIGMIVPDVTDFFFSKIIEGVENYINALGYVIILCNSRHSQEKENQYLEELSHRSVDGIMLATPHILSKEHSLESGFYKNRPIMLIDRGLNRRDSGRLLVKEYEGVYQAVNQLIKAGHKQIGMLKETTGYYQLEERFNGYRQALKDHQLPFSGKFVASGDLTVSGGYEAAKNLLRKNKELTAIFCGNDAMAIGCYQAIYESGRKIPEDISVIGFDGLKLSEYIYPPLTTILQPSFEIGYYAAKFLIDAIEYPDKKIPNKTFETKLIIRESVKGLTSETR
ncbi:LacI family transcriptional regulator [Enterococcus sp. AZ194]|uniref:LacI family DNA-binding transcriptional regulator n=1 Tax=Enterococcus sp. AZ194 TaxID=2774629 RepID=UPI003F291A1E